MNFHLLVPILATSVVLYSGSAPAAGEAAADWRPELGIPLTPTACGNCDQGSCGTGAHAFGFGSGGPDNANGEGNHSCSSGWCSLEHADPNRECLFEDQDEEFVALGPDEVSEVWLAATADSGPQLVTLVGEMGSAVSVNLDRSALQVFDCSGHPILSVPLSAAQLVHFREADRHAQPRTPASKVFTGAVQ